MQNSDKASKITIYFRSLICSIVILFGLFVMIVPIVQTISISSIVSEDLSQVAFVLAVFGFLFLPSVVYCVIAMRTNKIEYVIIPALFLLTAEYYFFYNFSTWIASDANAAIGLILIPFYLFFILVCAYVLAFVVFKIRTYINGLD